MSTSDVPDGQRRPSGEDRPLTRREMKERGVTFTTELPAVDPGQVTGAAAGAAHADRTEHDRLDAGRAVTGGGLPTGEDGAEPGGEGEDGSERTGPARRPVVRAPLTASGIRTVDDSGAITSVQSAVGRAVEAATSPASWESAVSMPAVALGIRDVPVGPSRDARPAGPAETAAAEEDEPEQEPELERERTGRTPEAASTAEDVRAADSEQAVPAPSPEDTTRAPQEVAEESVAPTPVRRGSRTTAVVVGVVLVVLIVVVLLVTLLSGGAQGADLSPGVREGCVGTLGVAPAFLRRRLPRPAEPTEETCDR